MKLYHAFVSPKSDSADATLVRPSNWNAPVRGGNLAPSSTDAYVAQSPTTTTDTAIVRWSGTTGDNIINNSNCFIDSSGELLIGSSTVVNIDGTGVWCEVAADENQWGVGLLTFGNTNGTMGLSFDKTRSASPTGNTIVQANDVLGGVYAAGRDGSSVSVVATQITFEVDGTPGSSDMPGRIRFWTSSDGSNTPAERLRIDNEGHVVISSGSIAIGGDALQIIGTTLNDASMNMQIYSNDNAGNQILYYKSRSTSFGGQTILNDNDEIGSFLAAGSDGTNFIDAAKIIFTVDGSPSAGTMPTRIQMLTTSSTSAGTLIERLRIDSKGNIFTSAGAATVPTTATNGFFNIPTSSGVPTVAPTLRTGQSPLVYDGNGSVLYIYNSSAASWRPIASS